VFCRRFFARVYFGMLGFKQARVLHCRLGTEPSPQEKQDMLSLVVAMAENGIIGKDGDMPWHLPDDLKHFKAMTLGKPIIMGRKTWDEVGPPLPGRRNIVISRQADFLAQGAEVVSSLEAALALTQEAAEVAVIGGAQIYQQALPLAQRLHRTLICGEPVGDTHFPAVDWSQWKLIEERAHPADERHAYAMRFQLFERTG
jgi:dihydrofolate reductase